MFTNDRGVSTVPDLDQALNDRLQLSQAIRDINRYALARIDHRTNSIQMHRLVQAVLISQMRPDEQADMRHAAHLLLAANPPLAPDDDDQWARYGQLYPHVIATRYLYHRGDHGASRDMAQRVYDIWSARLGTDDPDTLRVVGEYEQSAAFDAELLETHQRVFGDAHENTLAAINSVTGDRRAEGDFAGVLELAQRNYRQTLELFGEDDPLTLTTADSLGVSLRLSGRFNEALNWTDELGGARSISTASTT